MALVLGQVEVAALERLFWREPQRRDSAAPAKALIFAKCEKMMLFVGRDSS
jgi:hypothetical protein